MSQISVVLRACSLVQAVCGGTATRRVCGAVSVPALAQERWIISGIVTSMSADHRRVVTRDAIYDIADYVAEPSAWRRERVVWHLWCQTWLLPDCLEWLRPDGSIHDTWTRRQMASSIRAELADRARLRRALEDALDGDGREV